METLTISHFPYYDFEDRDLAYTVGSAFYGIYFIVSFPVYFFLDEERTPAKATSTIQALVDAAASSLASGMLVLLLLDLTRLSVVGVPLHVGGKLVEATGY
jgi:cycloeucalenol cycloisomerase